MGDSFSFLPNYTGPYISNGEIQASVEFGNRKPKDPLDALSRLHDSAYAKWTDRLHRTVADQMYGEEVAQLQSLSADMAGTAVVYGNHVGRSTAVIWDSFIDYGPLGLVVGGIRNSSDLDDLVKYGADVREEIIRYRKTDPFPHFQIGRSKKMGNSDSKRYASDFDVNTGGWLDPNRPGGSVSRKADSEKSSAATPDKKIDFISRDLRPTVYDGSGTVDSTPGVVTETYTGQETGFTTQKYNPSITEERYPRANSNREVPFFVRMYGIHRNAPRKRKKVKRNKIHISL